jgi:peptidylprolyl isomerase domain and WD repeat-containing protein 1
VPTSITLSPDCQLFVIVSNEDRQVRVFKFTTGKLIKTYDESLDVYRDLQQVMLN